jgi:hypothetical protein
VYISRDVVFDEHVFPFEALHPNAGVILKKEILLLPFSSSPKGAHNCDDHMTTIVPITNVSQAGTLQKKFQLKWCIQSSKN